MESGWPLLEMIAWSASGTRLTVSSCTNFRGTNIGVYSVAFHPDGKNLVSGDRQGGLKHWDAVAGKEVRDLQVARVLWTEASLSSGAAGAGVLSLAFDESGDFTRCLRSDRRHRWRPE